MCISIHAVLSVGCSCVGVCVCVFKRSLLLPLTCVRDTNIYSSLLSHTHSLTAALQEHPNVVVRSDWAHLRELLPEAIDQQVAIVTGGGSGHEPAHIGYVCGCAVCE
jgi:hypothetical protein